MIRHDAYTQFATVHELGPYGPVLHVFGDVDQVSAPLLESAIDDVAGDETLMVNFAKCRYLDASGLTVLVRERKRLGTRLQLLFKPASSPLRVMQVAGLDRVFSVVTQLGSTPG
jgi:anti-anti-sigma factor